MPCASSAALGIWLFKVLLLFLLPLLLLLLLFPLLILFVLLLWPPQASKCSIFHLNGRQAASQKFMHVHLLLTPPRLRPRTAHTPHTTLTHHLATPLSI